MKPIAVAMLVAGVVTSGLQAQAPREDARFDVRPLADGVFALVHREPTTPDTGPNTVFIVNADDVMVVDAGNREDARAAMEALRRLTDKPVRYVITTHWHDEHAVGNSVYAAAFPDVDIIGHAAALANGSPSRQPTGGRPTMPVTERLTFRRGTRTIEILALDPAHSGGDLLVYLPAERIAIAGDLVSWPVPDVREDSSIAGWVRALDVVRALQPGVIVPGHGPVLQDASHVGTLRDMLADVDAQVRSAAGPSSTLDTARAAVRLDRWRAQVIAASPCAGGLFETFVAGPVVAAAYRDAVRAR